MKTLFSVFKKGLQKTSTALSRSVESLFKDVHNWGPEDYRKLEAVLLQSDFGVRSTQKIVSDIKDRYERGLIKSSHDIFGVCAEDVKALFPDDMRALRLAPHGSPSVIMMVGVNGSGKTTTSGKLAGQFVADGKKVMLCACDTFRAAAVEQLKLWAEKTGSAFVSSKSGADPAAVAFDATTSALAKKMDYLIIDTAGRQHTKKGLMEELAKIARVVKKVIADAPHETLLTVDAVTGANALNQAREFAKFADISGLILTKLDGSGKGGSLVAIHAELKLPIFFVGLGEQMEDLQPFSSELFTKAIFGMRGE
jgi:fused signal recognition particle receptor